MSRCIETRVEGHPALALAGSGGTLQATFLPSLGMVCCSLQHEGEELLGQGGGVAAYSARGSTFGIPLLHPWANRLSAWDYDAGGKVVALDRSSSFVHVDGGTGLPIHGLLAASHFWTVAQSGADTDTARMSAELDFGAHPELLALFPFPHRLELSVAVEATRLSIRLTLIPTTAAPVPISFGFHPYLRLPGSERGDWRIGLPVRRRALLDDRGIPTGASEPIADDELNGPLGERTFDDCFDQLGPGQFTLSDARRRITVEFVEGFSVAQVYAPLGAGFICFEPMTAPVDALRTGRGVRWAEPGEPFSAEFAIAVTP